MYAIDCRGIKKVFRVYERPSFRLKEILLRKSLHMDFLALDGVTFNLSPGETLGLFGDNGAGKSTLLKILAGTLEPTAGTLDVKGRVTALLELGAGFHPEFTGRQNIYLNAALFGMTEDEIREREQAIIAFSELGEFIDQPVKIYSSGMYVRLAFSIATSVDPDVLIVDEALSVGDQHFQKKCVDRMVGFCREGKTIIFCSHSIYHLEQLCKRGLWLHKGKVRALGPIKATLGAYQDYLRELEAREKDASNEMSEDKGPAEDLIVYIEKLWVEALNGEVLEGVETGAALRLKMRIRAIKKGVSGHVGLGIIRNDETLMFGTTTHIDHLDGVTFEDNREFELLIPSMPLLPGTFMVLGLLTDETGLHPYHMARSKPFKVTSRSGYYGVVEMEHQWRL